MTTEQLITNMKRSKKRKTGVQMSQAAAEAKAEGIIHIGGHENLGSFLNKACNG